MDFTADMEEKLDEIEEKGLEWRKVVEDFTALNRWWNGRRKRWKR